MRSTTRIGIVIGLIVAASAAQAGGLRFAATLSTAQVVTPPNPGSIAGATIVAQFDEGFTQLRVRLTVDGAETVSAAHFHCAGPGANGPVALGVLPELVLDQGVAEGVLTNADMRGANCVNSIGVPLENLVSLAFAMRDGLVYMNVHTSDNPGGEFRGQMLMDRAHDLGPGDGDDDDDDDDYRPRAHGNSLHGQLMLEQTRSTAIDIAFN